MNNLLTTLSKFFSRSRWNLPLLMLDHGVQSNWITPESMVFIGWSTLAGVAALLQLLYSNFGFFDYISFLIQAKNIFDIILINYKGELCPI